MQWRHRCDVVVSWLVEVLCLSLMWATASAQPIIVGGQLDLLSCVENCVAEIKLPGHKSPSTQICRSYCTCDMTFDPNDPYKWGGSATNIDVAAARVYQKQYCAATYFPNTFNMPPPLPGQVKPGPIKKPPPTAEEVKESREWKGCFDALVKSEMITSKARDAFMASCERRGTPLTDEEMSAYKAEDAGYAAGLKARKSASGGCSKDREQNVLQCMDRATKLAIAGPLICEWERGVIVARRRMTDKNNTPARNALEKMEGEYAADCGVRKRE